MRLHATPIQDVTLGVQKIHSQLQSLCLEFHSLKKAKETKLEVHVEVWCIKCKSEGHDKDHCLVFANYISGGGPIPLKLKAPVAPSMGAVLWCAICQVPGKHTMDNCPSKVRSYTATVVL